MEGVILHYLCLNKIANSDMGSLYSQLSQIHCVIGRPLISHVMKLGEKKMEWRVEGLARGDTCFTIRELSAY